MDQQKLLKALEGHPLVKEIIQNDIDEVNALRKRAIDEIALQDKSYAERKEFYEPKIAALEKSAAEYQEKLQSLRLQIGKYQWEIRLAGTHQQTLQNQLRGLLLRTYPKEIDDFLTYLHKQLNALGTHVSSVKNILDDETGLVETHTNILSIARAGEYLRTAISEMETLKTSDLTGIDLTAKFNEIIADFPKWEEIETVVSRLGKERHWTLPRTSWVNRPL
jgi:hypothetical protein